MSERTLFLSKSYPTRQPYPTRRRSDRVRRPRPAADHLRELDGDLKRRFDDHVRATWSERSRPGLGPYLDPWQSPDWERCEIRLCGARHATLDRGADGAAVLQANGYRWTFDGRCMELLATLLRGAPVRAGAFREALPEGAAADLADDFLKLLVEQGIATATPPT